MTNIQLPVCTSLGYSQVKLPQELTDVCVLFTGTLFSDGYGAVHDSNAGRTYKAHRLAYCIHNNLKLEQIEGKVVMHKCDVRDCINPTHLVLGTQAENNADRQAKGRSSDRRGANCPTAKLTPELVREIRACRGSCIAIAAKYGVSPKCVNNIQRGITWKNVP